MSLADEVRELQSVHTRLTRHLQQASTSDQLRESKSPTVFETLSPNERELERELCQSYGGHAGLAVEHSTYTTDLRTESEETWRETHGAYGDLATRMRTTEAYIWEFLDRIEHRRRQLHTGVIYYSEANVVSVWLLFGSACLRIIKLTH